MSLETIEDSNTTDEISEEKVKEIYQEVFDALRVSTELAVMDKYGDEWLQESIDEERKNNLLLEYWANPHNSSPASKFSFIFEATIKESIRNGEITQLSDIPQNELIDHLFTFIKEHDIATKFAKRYDALEKEKGENIEPLTLENYRSSGGYGWVYNFVQADIIWSKYKNKGGPDVVSNIEDWTVSSSREFENAIKKLISIHGPHLLKYFKNKFYRMLSQTESLMENICEVEHIVEHDLGKIHTDKTRIEILQAFDEVTKDNPFIWINLQSEGFKEKLIRDVEVFLKNNDSKRAA